MLIHCMFFKTPKRGRTNGARTHEVGQTRERYPPPLNGNRQISKGVNTTLAQVKAKLLLCVRKGHYVQQVVMHHLLLQ